MEMAPENSSYNNNRGNQNINYGTQVFCGDSVQSLHGVSRVEYNTSELYEKKPFVSIMFQLLTEIIGLLSAAFSMYEVIRSSYESSTSQNIFFRILSIFDMTNVEMVWLFISLTSTVLFLSCLIGTTELQQKCVCKNLVRSGHNVYRIKPRRCPKCGGKLKFNCVDGIWAFRCIRVEKIHVYQVDPTSL